MASFEDRVAAIGEDLFARMKGNKPGVFDKAWWNGQVLEWAMKDPAFKTEMFRFVDVFPVLDGPDEIGRHIQEYLLRPGLSAPAAIKLALKGANLGKLAMKVAAGQIEKNMTGMARTFIAGTHAADAVETLTAMRRQKQTFTVDLLGEATVSEVEADAYAARYRDLIAGLADHAASFTPDPLLDRDDQGPIPTVNVSIKASAMYSQFDPLDFDGSVEAAARRLLPLFELARNRGVFLNLDMEQHALKDLTLALFRRVMEDPAMAGWEHAGVVIQAYHREAEADLEALIKWAKKQKKRVTVRLVKGAYWDYETVRAAQEGWPSPVWLDKADSDACFERCAELMLGNHKHIRSAIGSHNVRSLAYAIATAERHKIPISGYELQCLYGMAEPIKAAAVERGHRVRVYTPIGDLIPGMAYLVRRLLENTSNESWLRQGFAEGRSQEALLAAPKPRGRGPMLRALPSTETAIDSAEPFRNEPLRDFVDGKVRDAFADAVRKVDRQLGRQWTPIIDGKAVKGGEVMASIDPADGQTVIGTVSLASVDDAERAVAAARAYWPTWRDTPAKERARCLFKLAAKMRQERDALSALMVREVGKPWRQADAEVCEAIDFCEYYGREMLRLAVPRPMQNMPGETNHLTYRGRGVAVAIAPWNFPLAIFCGLVTAPLVAGNTVIAKPAEQSMVIAARMIELAYAAGVPAGALHFLPGRGEDVGAHLVAHPDVATIAFTGSKAVGLAIWKQAGLTLPGQPKLKRVVCEMGGKNAIIVDSDADLDEAVSGVLHSAFGFAGQKCSACSRVVVLREQHKAFVERLAEAVRSTVVGPPSHPGTLIGPVIDGEAQRRLLDVIADAKHRGVELAVGGEPIGRAGFYVPPTVFVGVNPADTLAQDEHFGPLLAVIEARDFDEALAIANGTEYALTGGLYSRSPSRIERARAEFAVGNLYINRGITGAIVGRQPFGGFAMSGGGTKAGGPDYLLSFLDPRVVTENTLRRGFAPEVEQPEGI
ncbi:MAG: L-glutamate gamma-semialdehyde dehydrogenase [Myxococcales bacterium]|nr:L-glutamate gamma-semialdehyde dehydrogenase [Myxococcales bacterium]MCB9550816.1 L-glutamate gamma-semialdehyde dehydrogenase [Myxococcales bacterium]